METEDSMKRVFGLMLFCFGAGMTIMLFIPETFGTLVFIIGCLVIGYNFRSEVYVSAVNCG